MCSRALERRDGLIRWFERNRRDLPWRVPSKRRNELRDPYRSWVAEVMLQQTQVAAVVEKFEAWMKALPTLRSLAEATDAEVERLWRGLGYYARARNLKKGAIRILESHGGEFPRDRAELERVPGIGPYSAGARRSWTGTSSGSAPGPRDETAPPATRPSSRGRGRSRGSSATARVRTWRTRR